VESALDAEPRLPRRGWLRSRSWTDRQGYSALVHRGPGWSS